MNSYITPSTPAGGGERITVSTTATGPSASSLVTNQTGGFRKRAVKAWLTVETDQVRLRYDGTAPTSTNGHLLGVGDSIVVEGEGNVSNIRLIRSSGASVDAAVQITYFYNL